MSEPYLVKPNFNHAPMNEDKKSFCRVGKHHEEIGCFTEVENFINLMVAPSGSYILRPFDGMWTLKVGDVDIFENYRDVSSYVKGIDYVTGLENKFSCNLTNILLLNDLEVHPEDIEKRWLKRSGTIFNSFNEMMTFAVWLEKINGVYVVTNMYIYILDENSSDLLNDLLDEIKDKHEEDVKALLDKDKEHDDAIKVLQDKDKEHDEKDKAHDDAIKALQDKDKSHDTKIQNILKYYEETDDGDLQHIYEEFPLLYNQNYVKAVVPNIMVDVMNGIVYYDLRFLMKSGFPTEESVIIAKTPNDFMPRISSPSNWTVRNNIINKDNEYYPVSNVTLKDGKGVVAFTAEENYGRVIVNAKDAIEENQFLYVSGSYFLKRDNVGNQNLNKTLTEHEGYVKIDKLVGHGAS